jgi:hypothetical protein
VDAMRLGRMRSASGGWGLRTGPVSRVVGVLVVLLVVLTVAPAGASAESMCTDDWSGSSEGEWSALANWSAGHVPGSSDVACIGSGNTVKVTSGTDLAGVVQGEGGVTISGGSLELTNTLEGSIIHSLRLTGGTLTGANTLKVSGSLTWEGGTMSGLGTTVLASSATGSMEGSSEVLLEQRTLINEGTFTLTKGLIKMSNGAEIKNTGTFVANSEGTDLTTGEGTPPLFVNTGTLQKTAGAETYISVDFENKGTVNGKTGKISFNSSSVTVVLTDGSVLEGSVLINGPSVTGDDFSSPSGTVTLQGGSLSMASGDTATVAHLVMISGGTLTGPGTMKVSGSLLWGSGTMSGSGSTVLMSGATGSTEEKRTTDIYERTFVNEGTFTFGNGQLIMRERAVIENSGTFYANAGGAFLYAEGLESEASLFVNMGTFEKTTESETYVNVTFENFGIIRELAGKLVFYTPRYYGVTTNLIL